MTEYIVKLVEDVYDANDEYEHSNPVGDVSLRADSLNEAVIRAREMAQKKITKYRREGGFMSSGSFFARIYEVRDAKGRLLQGFEERRDFF